MSDDSGDRAPRAVSAEASANKRGLLVPIWAALIIAFGTLCGALIISGQLTLVTDALDDRQPIRIIVNPGGWTLDVRNDGERNGTIEQRAWVVLSSSTGAKNIDVDIYPTNRSMTFEPGTSGRLYLSLPKTRHLKPNLPQDATMCALKYQVQSGSDTNDHQDAFECHP